MRARRSYTRQRDPDFYIKSIVNPQFRVSVQKSDIFRESSLLTEAITTQQNHHPVNGISLDVPVFPVHLKYLRQFFYTGDYAVEAPDVMNFPIDRKSHPNGCKSCVNHLRLLNFHLSMFYAARYLGMETLELLAMNRITAAMEHATPTVLRYIVQDVYQIEPMSPKSLNPSLYSLADWSDYRPILVLPAIMNHIRHHYPAIETHYDSVVFGPDGQRIETVRAGWSDGDRFSAIRKKLPVFDQHLRWAEAVLAREHENSRLLELSELDLEQFVSEKFQQQKAHVTFDKAYLKELNQELGNGVAKFWASFVEWIDV
ncbi:hypothetical protein VI817_003670 [Penicillium citrinum]|nr:hypothetical protein VI817_003670 [Penicillium citrinum]